MCSAYAGMDCMPQTIAPGAARQAGNPRCIRLDQAARARPLPEMQWKIVSANEFAGWDDRFRLPLPDAAGARQASAAERSEQALAFAFQAAGTDRLHALTPPPADAAAPESKSEFPCGIYDEAELNDPAVWGALLRVTPLHRVDLAAYQQRLGDEFTRRFAAETLLVAAGGKTNFKTLSEWKELGALGETARRLGRRFDLPLNVLRLWSRLSDEHQNGWLALFEAHPFNRNFIRDIIGDLYDLDAADRNQALTDAQQHAAAWLARKTRSRAYPVGEVRDLVRARRSPGIEALRRRMIQTRRELGLPGGVQLEWPVDLEQRRLTLSVQFNSIEQLESQLAAVQRPEFQRGAAAMLDAL